MDVGMDRSKSMKIWSHWLWMKFGHWPKSVLYPKNTVSSLETQCGLVSTTCIWMYSSHFEICWTTMVPRCSKSNGPTGGSHKNQEPSRWEQQHQPRFSSHCSQAALLRGCPCKSTMWNLGVATSWGKLSRFLLANRVRLLGLVATLVVSQQWSTRRPQWGWRCWGRKQKPGLDRGGWDGEGDQRQTGKKRKAACLRSKNHLGCYAVCHVTNWRKTLLSYHISSSYGIPEVTCLFLLSRCLCANPKRPSEKPDTRTTSTTSTWLIGHTLFVSICALAMTTMGIAKPTQLQYEPRHSLTQNSQFK